MFANDCPKSDWIEAIVMTSTLSLGYRSREAYMTSTCSDVRTRDDYYFLRKL
uniref:Uncharacterized protein n=1 Tax=Arundo donax TaxID=35708 RepID=A0A0A9DL17_ARUDO